MELLDGKSLSAKVKDNVKGGIASYIQTPILAVITIGDDAASEVYVNTKRKACEYVGMSFLHFNYVHNVKESVVIKKIKELNKDKTINGIILQLPIPKEYNVSKEATDAIFENAGIDKVSEGTRISGDIIATTVTNNTGRRYNDVLKLNWQGSTDKQKVYHTMFAILSTHIRSRDPFVDLNQFLANIPSSVGDHSCFKASGSFNIPLLNGETMDIEYFNGVISSQSSKIQANKFVEFERSDGSFACRHEFVKYPKKGASIPKIFIVFPENFSNIYDKTYNK